MADDLLSQAAHELYGLDPAGFTARRNALAAQARKSGSGDIATQIAALRRPTRAAWILNCLSRSDPDVAGEFAALGDALREAHLKLDGTQLRELSKQRRHLIDQAAAAAFTAAGIERPPAALRDEVTETLGAVLASADVADRFTNGILVTAEDQSGFGPVGPLLASVPTAGADRADRADRTDRTDRADRADREPPAARPVALKRVSAQDRRREKALAAATDELAQATAAQVAAEQAAQEAGEDARQLTEQLADARRREDDALLDIRHAENRAAKAQAALERLRDG